MTLRRLFTAVGAGITAFVVVAVAEIELLDVEFAAIVGLPVGLVPGVGVLVAVLRRHDEVADAIR